MSEKCSYIVNVCYGFLIAAVTDHYEALRRHLLGQVEHIASIAFAKDHGGANDHQRTPLILCRPTPVNTLRHTLRATVFVVGTNRAVLVSDPIRNPVDSDATSEDKTRQPGVPCSFAKNTRAADINGSVP